MKDGHHGYESVTEISTVKSPRNLSQSPALTAGEESVFHQHRKAEISGPARWVYLNESYFMLRHNGEKTIYMFIKRQEDIL